MTCVQYGRRTLESSVTRDRRGIDRFFCKIFDVDGRYVLSAGHGATSADIAIEAGKRKVDGLCNCCGEFRGTCEAKRVYSLEPVRHPPIFAIEAANFIGAEDVARIIGTSDIRRATLAQLSDLAKYAYTKGWLGWHP